MSLSGYSPVGDLVVTSICLVMLVLMFFSYNRHTKSFRVFLLLVILLILSAVSNVAFNFIVYRGNPDAFVFAYVLRCVYHALLFSMFFFFVVYIAEATQLDKHTRTLYTHASALCWAVVVLTDVAETVAGRGIHITADGVVFRGADIFLYGYITFLVLLLVLLTNVRKRLFRRVMLGFYGTVAVSMVMLTLQGLHGQISFTVATFLYPVIGMFYIMHSNPYDAQLGALDSRAFADAVKTAYDKHRDFVFLSLSLRSLGAEEAFPLAEIQALIRRYSSESFRGALLFQPGPGWDILIFPKNRNPDYQDRIRRVLDGFYEEYEKYGLDYKLVIGESIDEISKNNAYVDFIRSVLAHMDQNTVHRVNEEDTGRYERRSYIFRELSDIYKRHDLDDPRVLAYCQPVYNIRRKKYDTAEALMRLRLEKTGLVFPDEFIPMAEENGFIHVLTEIILHKTCEQIRRLTAAGYEVARISVNVSAPELKDNAFSSDIGRILNRSGIPGDKIAIELTESQNEDDFKLMKDKIFELKEHGIKFYLDDFGTGYSNMERIMELPFDIIKFDRSLVLASRAEERSREIVSSLASMFAKMNYSVLYEGVEEDKEEEMCMEMDASFLQGYKYSRPVPIEKLESYFSRDAG